MEGFRSLGLYDDLLDAINDEGYEEPTPVQEQAIPLLLEGQDVLGVAQTGTGKTAAFALPVLQIMARRGRPSGRRMIRALILSPTRELAAQIGERFGAYGKHMDVRHHVIFGGVNQNPQVKALKKGIDVLVATPGRLLDLIQQRHIDLKAVEFFVLDEADRMLDMGFIHDIKRVLKLLPNKRQNLLFSATMPRSISKLADSFLNNAVRIEMTPDELTVESVEQRVMFVQTKNKKHLLTQIIKDHDVNCAIVFIRMKHSADRLVKELKKFGIKAVAIHGNKTQAARTRALDDFRRGKTPILVATDIASRGIDVNDVTHVFNFDLPDEPEAYVHRIGRTARAGKSGVALAFCDETEGFKLREIERLTGERIEVEEDHPFHFEEAVPPMKPARPHNRFGSGRRKRSGDKRQNRHQKSRNHKGRGQNNRSQQNRTGGNRSKSHRGQKGHGQKNFREKNSNHNNSNQKNQTQKNRSQNHRGRKGQKRPGGSKRDAHQ
ncbi:MAG TPA: DEAD/DEAH box helicase [Candidatus Poseidoniales archaeon]|nr:DEAD/DEAH box helicase [Candidatus Poseidoniales archaeon]